MLIYDVCVFQNSFYFFKNYIFILCFFNSLLRILLLCRSSLPCKGTIDSVKSKYRQWHERENKAVEDNSEGVIRGGCD